MDCSESLQTCLMGYKAVPMQINDTVQQLQPGMPSQAVLMFQSLVLGQHSVQMRQLDYVRLTIPSSHCLPA